ncbi:MAG: hypothetical protein K8I27_11230 [Planctomycetes bacterium]|nr:hypothetical protein [Planctomycetota bacterium]
MLNSIMVSNRFVAEGIAGHESTLVAARELAEAALDLVTPVAFIGSHAFRRSRTLEVIAPRGQNLDTAPGFVAGVEPAWLRHVHTRICIRVHTAGDPIAGGPTRWADPRESENYRGVPVLRLNAFLETELTRALNAPDGAEHAQNVVSAILSAGISLDRTLELHPYVTGAYLDAWERAQGKRLWPAAA